MKIKIRRFDKELLLPRYVPAGAAAFDFSCRTSVDIEPGETKAIPLNVAIEVPKNYVLLLMPRSSTFGKFGLIMSQSVGVVDPYYSGDDNELVAVLHNIGKKTAKIKKGDELVHGLLVKSEGVEFNEVQSLGKGIGPAWDSSVLDGDTSN